MSDFAIPLTESEEDVWSGMYNRRINHLCPDLVFHQAPDPAFCTFTDLERWDCNCCELCDWIACHLARMWEIIEAFNKYNTLLIVTNATCQKIERQNIEIPDNAWASTKKVISSATWVARLKDPGNVHLITCHKSRGNDLNARLSGSSSSLEPC